MTKLICTKDNPAPLGSPIAPFPGSKHLANPEWEHPEVRVEYLLTTFSMPGDVDPVFCKHCGGKLP